MEIVENGVSVAQSDSYNPVTKEAIARTPAHGNNKASTTVIQGGGSRSSGIGLMVTVVDDACYAHDLPEELNINPEDMENHKNQSTVQRQRVLPQQKKTLIIAKNVKQQRDITNRLDDFNITETMKEECKGKRVFFTTVDVHSEEEFESENHTIPTRFMQKLGDEKSNRYIIPGFCTQQKVRTIKTWYLLSFFWFFSMDVKYLFQILVIIGLTVD